MEREMIKNSLDQLNPTEEQSKMMWERLQKAMAEKNEQEANNASTDNVVAFEKTETIRNEAIDTTNEKVTQNTEEVQKETVVEIEQEASNVVSINSRRKNKLLKRAMAVAAAIALIIVGTVGANVATDGAVYAAIMKWLKFDQGRQDVVGNMVDSQDRFNTVWAPDIYYMDNEMLVFGGLRGIVIYDWNNNQVLGIIDTQKVDCVYFNSDKKRTHVLKDGNYIVIFNTDFKSGLYEVCYKYDLTKCKGQELDVAETSEDQEEIENYYQKWKELSMPDAFIEFRDYEEVQDLFSIEYESKYSENCYVWVNKDGKEIRSFLVIKDEKYMLYHFDTETQEFTNSTLDLSQAYELKNNAEEFIGDEDAKNVPVELKQFVYYGDDKAVEAIYHYMEAEYIQSAAGEMLWIPGYVIYKKEKVDGEYLIYGNFWAYYYQLTGCILEAQSGMEMPACFHLKETEKGYEVVSVEVAGDETYAEDIETFTRGDIDLYSEFMEYDEIERMEAQKEYVQMYVKGHNLDIEYYKEYGWDSVKIFD